MKKMIAVLVLAVLIQSAAFASTQSAADYEELKAYKKAQREKKAQEKANLPSGGQKQGFWAREASRSGFAGTGAMFSNAIFTAVPLNKPNSGKKA